MSCRSSSAKMPAPFGPQPLYKMLVTTFVLFARQPCLKVRRGCASRFMRIMRRRRGLRRPGRLLRRCTEAVPKGSDPGVRPLLEQPLNGGDHDQGCRHDLARWADARSAALAAMAEAGVHGLHG